jgi:predicted dehydrogenase/threonine dehydrogenase-like Zn-dependent dehydrogenase
MKQILQSLKNGELEVADVPEPACLPGRVRVRNVFSFVSPGTERASREVAKSSLLSKARQRPDQVRKVFEKVRTEGVFSTFQKVRSRLEEPAPLGYSSAGIVEEVGEGVFGIHPGDRVACAGAGYANHAEVVSVPRNLVAAIPDDVSFEEACGATLCAIALQGVRVADVRVGESVGVIGLGLLGQIVIQILKACGCTAVGIDLDPAMRAKAMEMGADWAILRNEPVEQIVASMTGGEGLDAVILCAATDSNDPVELAGELSRKKGRVVAVGTLPMNIPRRVYYPKELELRLSTSYGPGRYDPDYEERGRDYPYAYVRFTENRNLQTVLTLMSEKRLRLAPLVTHRFPISKGLEAYQLIEQGGKERPLGVLFDYSVPGSVKAVETTGRGAGAAKRDAENIGAPGVGVLGAGQFASAVLLPKIREIESARLWRVVTRRGATARAVAKRFSIPHQSCREEDLYEDPAVGAVIVATRHHQHASQTIAAVEAGKDVFVEKPLALNREQLEQVEAAVSRTGRTVMVGFNRRFAPMARHLRQWFLPREWPLVLSARINAGRVEKGSWLLDPEEGGGRIVGEVCHFIDLFSYWTGEEVEDLQVDCLRAERGVPAGEENISLLLRYSDGSTATLVYTSEGSPLVAKEYYEVHGGGRSAVLDDWRRLDLFDGRKKQTIRGRAQDKGHSAELKHFFECVEKGQDPELTFKECAATTRLTFDILDALRKPDPE